MISLTQPINFYCDNKINMNNTYKLAKRAQQFSPSKVLIKNQSSISISIQEFIKIIQFIVSNDNETAEKQLNRIGILSLKRQAIKARKDFFDLREEERKFNKLKKILDKILSHSAQGKKIDFSRSIDQSFHSVSSHSSSEKSIRMKKDPSFRIINNPNSRQTEEQLGTSFLYQFIHHSEEILDSVPSLLKYLTNLIEQVNPQDQSQLKDDSYRNWLPQIQQICSAIQKQHNRLNIQRNQLLSFKKWKQDNERIMKKENQKYRLIKEQSQTLKQSLQLEKKKAIGRKNKIITLQQQLKKLQTENQLLEQQKRQLNEEINILKKPIKAENCKYLVYNEIKNIIKISDQNKKKLTISQNKLEEVQNKLNQSYKEINKLNGKIEVEQLNKKTYGSQIIINETDNDVKIMQLEIKYQKDKRQNEQRLDKKILSLNKDLQSTKKQLNSMRQEAKHYANEAEKKSKKNVSWQNKSLGSDKLAMMIDNEHRQKIKKLAQALLKIKNELDQQSSFNSKKQMLFIQRVQKIIKNVYEVLEQVHYESSSITSNQTSRESRQ